MDIPSPFSTKAILPFCLRQPPQVPPGRHKCLLYLSSNPSPTETWQIRQPQPHILSQDVLTCRYATPIAPDPRNAGFISSCKSTLVLKIFRSTDSQGIHSSSRLVRPTETCCRQRRHGRNHLTQQREQDLSSSRQEGSYVARRLPSSDTRSGDPSPLCQHWMLSLRERSQWSCLCITACLSHGQCPAGPCCHFQVTAREHT